MSSTDRSSAKAPVLLPSAAGTISTEQEAAAPAETKSRAPGPSIGSAAKAAAAAKPAPRAAAASAPVGGASVPATGGDSKTPAAPARLSFGGAAPAPTTTTTSSVSGRTVWDALNTPLPNLPYQLEMLSTQGKGSTAWAAFSHTPAKVAIWKDFCALVSAEGVRTENREPCGVDLSHELSTLGLVEVTEEEHVTANTNVVLQRLAALILTNNKFNATSKYTASNSDIICQKKLESHITGSFDQYESESPGPARTRRSADLIKGQADAVQFTFETKPFWKFCFLTQDNSTNLICSEFEVPRHWKPADIQANKALPKSWSHEKKRIFHTVRQLYGQMVSSKRKYGVFHIYEIWWFCYRTTDGTLYVSDPIKARGNDEGPSVFQALKTLIGLGDHNLDEAGHNFRSPSAVAKRKQHRSDNRSDEEDDKKPRWKPTAKAKKTKLRSFTRTRKNLTRASDVLLEDCDLLDTTDDVKLFSIRDDPHTLVKLLRPKSQARSDEFHNEAIMYEEMWNKQRYKDILGATIPAYCGYSEHLGTPLICVGREGDTFYDIGLENLSRELKLSAVDAVRKLSQAGILHQDLALRNLVQSRDDPACAKIIDFGRSIFTTDQDLLRAQLIELKQLLDIIDP